jgi:hypothetical protein
VKKELCGKPTPTGPCTLEKNHRLEYCRHQLYEQTTWRITDPEGNELEKGTARVPMNYAITRCLKENDDIIVYLKKHQKGVGVDQTQY